LCQEDTYLLELVRYNHLNPLRAKTIHNYKELKKYPCDKNFVEQVLSAASEQMDRKNILIAKGYNLEIIADKVSSAMGLDASEIWTSGKSRSRVAARSLFCFRTVRELGISMAELSRPIEKVSKRGFCLKGGQTLFHLFDEM
jgi:hypothetical protein